jgi:flagellar basal-body rod modification protein FlgD
MSVNSVVSSATNSSTLSSATAVGSSELDMSTFLNLLVTQLENQDPTNPMSDSDFYAQIAQLGTVQGINTMTASMDNQQAVSLIGKTVTAVEPQDSDNVGTNQTITGVVQSVTVTDGVSYIGIQDSDGNIVKVTTSAIQSVGPAVDISSAADLIGQTVSGAYASTNSAGTTTYTAVTGTVVGAFVQNGQAMLSVEDSSGTTYSVGMDTVSTVGS